MARILLLSLFIGLVGVVIAGLAFLPVVLVFGGITAYVIMMTTPPLKESRHLSERGEGGHREERGEREEREERGHREENADKADYQPLPYQATVDPSGYLAPVKEHFVNGGNGKGSIQPVASPTGLEEVDAAPFSGLALPEQTPPTSRNPFMNILIDDIKYHPERPPAGAIDHPATQQVLDDYFRIQWFSDPTDVFGKNQSQRQFITQPSTTVPNDQGSFANWLYRIPGKTCKEGGREACLSGTDGGPLPWLNHDS